MRGMYATGLTEANIYKLDEFEGDEYKRIKVNVKLLKMEDEKEVEGEVKEADVYVFLNPDLLEKREWDFEEFREQKMKMWTRGDWAFSEGNSPGCYYATFGKFTDSRFRGEGSC